MMFITIITKITVNLVSNKIYEITESSEIFSVPHKGHFKFDDRRD
jgi:hypothetical protein